MLQDEHLWLKEQPTATPTIMITISTTSRMMIMAHCSFLEHFCIVAGEKKLDSIFNEILNLNVISIIILLSDHFYRPLPPPPPPCFSRLHTIYTLKVTPFSSCRLPSSTLITTSSTFFSIISMLYPQKKKKKKKKKKGKKLSYNTSKKTKPTLSKFIVWLNTLKEL